MKIRENEKMKSCISCCNKFAIHVHKWYYRIQGTGDTGMLFLVIDSINTKQIDAGQINVLKHTFGLYSDYGMEGKLKLCYAFADKPG